MTEIPLHHQDSVSYISYAPHPYTPVDETSLRGYGRSRSGMMWSHAAAPPPRLVPSAEYSPSTPGLTHWNLVGSEYSRKYTFSVARPGLRRPATAPPLR